MTFRLDKGKFTSMNYNRVVQLSRRKLYTPTVDSVDRPQAMEMYKIMQDMNSVTEPQLAIKRPQGKTRRGFI
jgi:hypothetical protein